MFDRCLGNLVKNQILMSVFRHLVEAKENRQLWPAGHEDPQMQRPGILELRQKSQDRSYIVLSRTFVQRLNHDYQFQTQ